MARQPDILKPLTIDIARLPDTSVTDQDFHDTSFFRSTEGGPPPQLPSPAELFRQNPTLGYDDLIFEHLNLVVKVRLSSQLRLEEAQCMRAIRQAFPDGEVPVPEVFGWRKYNEFTFLYMSLVPGTGLAFAWRSLTTEDKKSISDQLRSIVAGCPCPVGPIHSRGPAQDCMFQTDYVEGPFLSIKAYIDWVYAAATRQRPGLKEELVYPEVYRELRDYIPDTGKIYFTHGDLTLGNIMVSRDESGAYRITGIIDWEQAGWYPEYWEYWKMLYGVAHHHPWRTEGWADRVVEPVDDDTIYALAEFYKWRQP